MGWTGDTEDEDQYPVDTMVNAIQRQTDVFESICQDFRGTVLTCCQDTKACVYPFESSLVSVKLSGIFSQDLDLSCRSIHGSFRILEGCVNTIHRVCTQQGRRTVGPLFRSGLDNVNQELTNYCGQLKPTTENYETTAASVTNRTETTPVPMEVSTNTSQNLTSTFNESGSGNTSSLDTSYPGPHWLSIHDITIIAAVAGSVVLVTLLVLTMVKLCHKSSGEGDSKQQESTTKEERHGPCCICRSSKTKQEEEQDGEIYAEIDEHLFDAVYNSDDQSHVTKRPMKTIHSNACYESEITESRVNPIRQQKSPLSFAHSADVNPVKSVSQIRTPIEESRQRALPSPTPSPYPAHLQVYDTVFRQEHRERSLYDYSQQPPSPSSSKNRGGYDVASWVHQSRINRMRGKTNFNTGSLELDTNVTSKNNPRLTGRVYDRLQCPAPSYVNFQETRAAMDTPGTSYPVDYENEYQTLH